MHAKKLLDAQKEELEAIIHVVSHDLRAPLLNISGFNDILKDDCKTIREALAPESISNQTRTRLDEIFEQSAREAFEMINVSAAAMHRLIDSLVKVARAGLVVPTPEHIDMNHLLRNIIAGLRIKARQTGARIELADLPPCFADRTQTAQVFANLIENALKYLDPARPGRIYITGQVRDNTAAYSVTDNGVGIEPEQQGRIFEIFYQTDAAASGQGIGLSVVKKMLDKNNGTISLTSQKGKGSTFLVTLPRPPDQPQKNTTNC